MQHYYVIFLHSSQQSWSGLWKASYQQHYQAGNDKDLSEPAEPLLGHFILMKGNLYLQNQDNLVEDSYWTETANNKQIINLNFDWAEWSHAKVTNCHIYIAHLCFPIFSILPSFDCDFKITLGSDHIQFFVHFFIIQFTVAVKI